MEVSLDLSSATALFPPESAGAETKVPRFLWPRLPKADGRRKASESSASPASSSNSSSRKTSVASMTTMGSATEVGSARRKTPFYKFVDINPDVNEKSEWPEWARLRYRASYDYTQVCRRFTGSSYRLARRNLHTIVIVTSLSTIVCIHAAFRRGASVVGVNGTRYERLGLRLVEKNQKQSWSPSSFAHARRPFLPSQSYPLH